jgi:hypothetical protein
VVDVDQVRAARHEVGSGPRRGRDELRLLHTGTGDPTGGGETWGTLV